MKHRGFVLIATLVLGLFGVMPGEARAQGVTTASITGTVAGPDGVPAVGARVVAIHTPTGTEYSAVTRSGGQYTILGLRPGGPYRVQATLLGFSPRTVTGLRLDLGQTQQVNLTLQPTSVVLEGLTVVAERNNESANGVGTSLREGTIENAPTVNREIADLARLTPQAFVVNGDDDGAAISVAGQNNRYNAIYVDGVVANDVFGLSAQGTNGGQTGASPISFDAIEQLNIAISPFDVTQSGFTGAAINAVTRSGTNRLEGSAYVQTRNENLAGKTPGDINGAARTSLPDFSSNRYGVRLGGPIVRDRLFFFVNGELFRSKNPSAFDLGLYEGDEGARLPLLADVLNSELGYDPGGFGAKSSTLDDNKLLAKLDWNIADAHRLSIRHSYSHSDNTDAYASTASRINFANNSEVFPNTTNSTALEVNSRFGSRYANRLLLGANFVRDDRGFAGNPFPFVIINDGRGDIRLGSEPYSTGNILNQDQYSVTNNFNIFTGRHNITLGLSGEFFNIKNLFLRQNFGQYTYNSMDDFLRSVCAAGNGTSAYCQQLRAEMGGTVTPVAPSSFARGYSLVDDVTGDASGAIAAFKAYQVGAYAQDELQATDRLRLTLGLRVDVPRITTKPRYAQDVFETTIPDISEVNDLSGARPGETPKALPYFAPRIGFNYDVTEDGSTRVRGGVGIFTGRVPFVIPGAMYTNNGVTVGYVSTRNGRLANGETVPFVADPQNGLTAADFFGRNAIPSGELDLFSDDFRYPRVLRTSLGMDHDLPFGVRGTLEGQYTRTMDNLLVRNVNLRAQNDRLDGPDNRPVYNYGINTRFNSLDINASRIDRRYTDIFVVENTDAGYTYDLTASLEKEFSNALSARLALSRGDAFAVNDATSSQIVSTWRYNENVNGLNNLDRARSDFSLGTRVLGQLTYRQEFLRRLATTISAIYTGQSGRPYSYVIGNSIGFTGEGSGTSALAYVPNDASELQFKEYQSGGVTYTPEMQRAAFEAFIQGDDYLRGRRGGYTERNASRTPFENVVDLRLGQEIFGNFAGRRHRGEVTLDIFNFTNLLNRNWGRRYNAGFRTVDLLRFERFADPANGDLTPVYTFRQTARNADEYFENRLIDFGGYGSRWLMQLGFRYSF